VAQLVEMRLDVQPLCHVLVPLGYSIGRVRLRVRRRASSTDDEQVLRELLPQRARPFRHTFPLLTQDDDRFRVERDTAVLVGLGVLFLPVHPVAAKVDDFGVQVNAVEAQAAQLSPPDSVVITTQTRAPQSSSMLNALSTKRAASAEVGGSGCGGFCLGRRTIRVGLELIQSQRTAAFRVPLKIEWIGRLLTAILPRTSFIVRSMYPT
jgi:hypothetical protein